MIVTDVEVWLDSAIEKNEMRDFKAYIAANIGVLLVTDPVENIDDVTYLCATRRATSLLSDEMYEDDFKPFADKLIDECKASGIMALKDIRFMRNQNAYVVAVRGIWI